MLRLAEARRRHGNAIEIVAAQAAGPVRAKIQKATIGGERWVEITLRGVEGCGDGGAPSARNIGGCPNIVGACATRAIPGEPGGALAVRAEGEPDFRRLGR